MEYFSTNKKWIEKSFEHPENKTLVHPISKYEFSRLFKMRVNNVENITINIKPARIKASDLVVNKVLSQTLDILSDLKSNANI